MVRIPPKHHARSFLLSLETNILRELEKIEEIGTHGTRINTVAESILVDWVTESVAELESRYSLHYEEAASLGYGYAFRCRQSTFPAGFQRIHLRLCGRPRYFVERLGVCDPIEDIPNPLYLKSPEFIITDILTKRIPTFISGLRKDGSLGDDDYSIGGDEVYS